MALPVAGNGIRAEAQVLPTASLTDFTLLVDLTQIPVARLTHLFNDVNTSDGTRGRVSDLSNIELPFDWNDLTNQANPGYIRIKYTGTIPTTGTVGVIIYSPNTRNTAYPSNSTYGSENAYDINTVAYLPLTADFNDRTSFGNSAVGSGGISAGGSVGKVGASTRFDGIDDFLTIANSASLQNGGDITLSLVAKEPSGAYQRSLIYKSYSNAEYYLKLDSSDQLVYVQEYVDNTISTAISSSIWHQIVGKKDSNVLYGNIDGVDQGISIATTASGTWIADVQIGQEDGYFRFNGYMQHIFIHNVARDNAWIAEENAQTNDNSVFWGNWSDVTIGGGYSLDADAGTYLITGSNISLLHNRVLTAESGVYSLTGSDINLSINRVLNAESGNYTVNGSDIDLSVNRVITAESGSYNIIGADIEMSISSELAILAEAGHYEITGSDIDLIVNRVLNAESGSYNITGGDIDLTVVADKILNAESGNYNITGSDIELKIDRVLNAESGSYSIIGSDVELIWSGQPIAKGLVNISMDMKVQDITMDLKTQTITMELTV